MTPASLAAVDKLIESILLHARAEAAHQLVVGLPLNASGEETVQARATRAFAQRLANAAASPPAARSAPLPVLLCDERYSTSDAREVLAANRVVRRDDVRALIDAESAVAILTHFYEVRGAGAELVEPVAERRREGDDGRK